MIKPLLVIIFCFFCQYNFAQNSELKLLDEKNFEDYLPKKETKVYAAGRMLIDASEIPQNVHVIFRDEIARNGYSSLVDILKTLPEFRTSQPGSSQLGETFLSRGLVGNTYATILINGSPIKPLGAPGMPIGYQLPIKQAERIEIIIGPSSALYGSDAMAGVINIVISEVNKPIEVTSDILIGTGGQSEITTSIGGKLGKGKNVLSYCFYGNNKTIENYPLETSQFIVEDEITDNPYYMGEIDNVNEAVVRDIPHKSTLFGTTIGFRGFTLNSNFMYRQNHSALGASPNSISYANPGSSYGEYINHINLQYEKSLSKKWGAYLNTTYLDYKLDDNSNYTGVDHVLSNGLNFMYAESEDLRIEPVIKYKGKSLFFLVGSQLILTRGLGIQNFLGNPYRSNSVLETDSGLYVRNANGIDSSIEDLSKEIDNSDNSFSIFSQVFYQINKVNLIGSFRYEYPKSGNGVFNPNLGVVYKATKKINISANYAHAFQLPGLYYRSSNYYSASKKITLPNTPQSSFYVSLPFQKNNTVFEPEKLISFESNLTLSLNSNHSVKVKYFFQELSNSLFTETRTLYDSLKTPPPTGYFVGFYNRSSKSQLHGAQVSWYKKGKYIDFDLHTVYYSGAEEIDEVGSIDGYRSVPEYSIKGNVYWNFKKKNTLGLMFTWESDFINQVRVVKDELLKENTDAFYNIDVFYNRVLVKRLNGGIKVTNLTNSITKGVFTNWMDGTDFNYTPQLERWIVLSLSYRLN